MKCNSIAFSNFRNVESEKCNFSDGVNVLWGKNAQGKSNILEGIYFFARGRSFRGAKEKELIRFGEKEAALSLEFLKEGDRYPVSLSAGIPQDGRKTLYRNGAKLSGSKEMMGSFRAVLFCPAHLTLVSGGPALRRSFLDIALSQLYPAYLDSLSRYNRAHLQRNALIKKAQSTGKNTYDSIIWETYAEQMATFGADIFARRLEYMNELSASVEELFLRMTEGREKPSLSYRSSALGEDASEITRAAKTKLYDALLSNLDREIIIGSSLYGVHKDDISVRLNGKEAKVFASQGQQRSLALSMKLAEGEMSKKISGEYPVFLLDDVLSELDGDRRAFILRSLSDRQLIVTSCEPEIFRSMDSSSRLIHVRDGKIAEVDG
ncbi:MAG: DNA replication/repair protein RecF [Clostridia bacterium]|nr:DNA replication/repair protein RecF [Clostridia bacterium]